MALRLLAAGHRVRVCDRDPARLAPTVARGAVACASPAEASRGADVVLACLTDAAAMLPRALAGGMEEAGRGGEEPSRLVDLYRAEPTPRS